MPVYYQNLQSNNSGAFILGSGAYTDATQATGVGGYLHTSGVTGNWSDVKFFSVLAYSGADLFSGNPLGHAKNAQASGYDFLMATGNVLGGTGTPIGHLRGENAYVNMGTETPATPNAGDIMTGAFYAAYGNPIQGYTYSGKICVGSSAPSDGTQFYEGQVELGNIYRFETEFEPNTGNLSATGAGSGVYLDESVVTIEASITDQQGNPITDRASLEASPFVDYIEIDLLNADGTMAAKNWKTNWRSPRVSIERIDKVNIWGQKPPLDYITRFNVYGREGRIQTTDMHLFANKVVPVSVTTLQSGKTTKTETSGDVPAFETGSIGTYEDALDAVRFTTNQKLNASGASGEVVCIFDFEDDQYTQIESVGAWASTGGPPIINQENFLGNLPLAQAGAGQRIVLDRGIGLPEAKDFWVKFAFQGGAGVADHIWEDGPFMIEPVSGGMNPTLTDLGDQRIRSGNFIVGGDGAGYITANCLTIGPPGYDHPYTIYTRSGYVGIGTNDIPLFGTAKLSVNGDAVGTGDGNRLTGPNSLPYLLSGDAAGTESDTLQTVADRGNTTTTDIGIGISTTPTNKLDVAGAVAIGSTYAGTTSAPSNGLLVEGNVGIGSSVGIGFSTTPNAQLQVSASAGAPTFRLSRAATAQIWEQTIDSSNRWHLREAASEGGTQYTRLQIDDDGETLIAPNGGNVGIGISTTPSNKLDVAGAVGIGSTYAGTTSAPSNGLLVEGNVGIGITGVTAQKLYVKGASAEVELATDDGYSIKSPQKAIIAGVGIGTISSTGSMIAGGSGHHISGDYDTIAGGTLNNISGGDFNFIGGGSQIDLTGSDYSSSIGGKNNDIFYSDYAIIGGGRNNKIESATVAFIGGGSSNEIHDGVSAIAGGVSNLISGGNGYSFVGGGEENMVYGTFSSILGGEGNKVYGNDAVTLGGWFSESTGKFALVGPGRASKVSGDYAVGLGNKVEIPIAHTGATVLADGQDRVHASSGMHTATLDFASGVYVPTIGYFGQGLHVSGVPVLTGENNPAEADTLQTVTTRGNTTSTSILSTGPHISGVTGLFSNQVGIGTDIPETTLELATTMSSSPTTQLYLDVDGSNIVGGGGELIFSTSASAGAKDAFNAIVRGERSSLNDGSSDLTFLTTHVPTSATAAARMTIKDAGNVGIGSISPVRKLDVSTNGADTYGIRNSYNSSYYMEMAHNRFNTVGNNYIRFNIDDATKMTIVDADFGGGVNGVGIGITNPTAELQVIGDISGSGSFLGTGVGNRITNNHIPYLLSGDEAGATNTLQDVTNNGNHTTNSIYINGSGDDANYAPLNVSGNTTLAFFRGTGTAAYLQFQNSTTSYGLSSQQGLTVGNNGNDAYVMQREASPLYLGTSGEARMTIMGDNAHSKVGVGTVSPASTAGSDSFLEVYGATDAGLVVSSNNGDWDIKNTNPNADLVFYRDGSTRVTFAQAGNVGIGSAVPARKLDVVGDAAVSTNLVVGTALYSNQWIANSSATQYIKNSSAATSVAITNSGYVGIKNDNPEYALDVSGDVAGTGAGSRITLNGTPYLLSGDSPAETQTLQNVCDNGNTTTTSINSTGPHISGGTGIFMEKLAVGTAYSSYNATIKGTLQVKDVGGTYDGLLFTSNVGGEGRIMATNTDHGTTHPLWLGGEYLKFTVKTGAEVEAMRLVQGSDGSGRLGINTTDPSNTLDIHVSSSDQGIELYTTPYTRTAAQLVADNAINGNADLRLYHATQVQTRISSNPGSTTFFNSNNVGVRTKTPTTEFQVSGTISGDSGLFGDEVGIGTVSPLATLDVRGNISGSGSFIGTGAGGRITNNGVPYLLSGDSPAENDTLQDVTTRGNTTTTSIEVANGTIISGSTATTPAADLYVFGSGNSDVINAVRERNDASIKVTSQTAGAYFRTNSATATYNGLDLNSNWFIGQYGYNDLRIVDGTASAGDSAAAITVQNSTKNVGIGTTNPAQTLHVEGTARVSGHTDLASSVDISSKTRIYNKLGVGVGSTWVDPANGIDVYGSVAIGASYIGVSAPSNGAIIEGNVGIGTSYASNALDVNGHLSATSKSFLIDHPIEENKKLQYACLEGPENGVYVRGTTNSASIELPDYWSELIHEDSITVVVTPIGKKQDLYIKSKSPKIIMIGGVKGSYDYVVYGERKDIDRLETEPLKV